MNYPAYTEQPRLAAEYVQQPPVPQPQSYYTYTQPQQQWYNEYNSESDNRVSYNVPTYIPRSYNHSIASNPSRSPVIGPPGQSITEQMTRLSISENRTPETIERMNSDSIAYQQIPGGLINPYSEDDTHETIIDNTQPVWIKRTFSSPHPQKYEYDNRVKYGNLPIGEKIIETQEYLSDVYLSF